MSMYDGLDLSRFKKIASNDKMATLRHSKGHEIKIARSGLSPKMREHIDSLPVYMAEGGDPAALDPESPEGADDAPEDVPSEAIPSEVVEEPVATENEPQDEENQSPRDIPPENVVDVVGQRKRAIPKPPTVEDLDNETALTADDMAKGHITPETRASLFAKKSTLGKIGSIFGMMLGGAGAGLTHGPNVYLDLMQKEISNDLEAQKQSNLNAQNWLRLSHEHEMQKAQLGKMNIENIKTMADTTKIPYESDLLKAQAANARADIPVKATSATLNNMSIAAYQHLTDMVNKMPDGPQKMQGQAFLKDIIGPAIIQKTKENNAKTAGHLQLRSAVRGDMVKDPPEDNGTGVDFDKLNILAQQGQMAEKLGLPGGMRGADVSSATEEARRVAANRSIAKMYKDSFDRLDQLALAGKLNPQLRDAEVTALVAKISHAAIGTFNKNEQVALANSMLPSALDWGKSRDEKFRKTMDHFASEETDTPTLDRFKLKSPFPEYSRAKSKKTAAEAPSKKSPDKSSQNKPYEGARGTDPGTGKKVVFTNGKWVAAK